MDLKKSYRESPHLSKSGNRKNLINSSPQKSRLKTRNFKSFDENSRFKRKRFILKNSLTQGNSNLNGGAGNDNLTGNGSKDTLVAGNSLNNSITGNSLDNYLAGEKGNDSLIGGLGNDTLVGYGGDKEKDV